MQNNANLNRIGQLGPGLVNISGSDDIQIKQTNRFFDKSVCIPWTEYIVSY